MKNTSSFKTTTSLKVAMHCVAFLWMLNPAAAEVKTAPSGAAALSFESFEKESVAVGDLIKCPKERMTKTPGFPDLWGCIWPGAEVVKVFINEDGSGGVKNVKVMWNDWTRDVGYGVHTDAEMARAWLAALATRYAPEAVEDVLLTFDSASNKTIESDTHRLVYTYEKGPAIDERLFTISAK
ncbi:hypothetical protein [Brucella anthropi]|uniref:hypothetical protein n=1 Tax=Brucella anthropi TaxID=529 RepID=UPI002361928A|nr:hypothetical protein [Brucella anthropi]